MAKPLPFSIIIPTAGNPDSLRNTLKSLNALNVPDDMAGELILADNTVEKRHANALAALNHPQIEPVYVSQPIRGAASARNAGLRIARGEAILFTDDDLLVPSEWFATMGLPILRDKADFICGGVVTAERLKREWMGTNHFGSNLGRDPKRGFLTMSANLSIHRRVLETVPWFDPELGPGRLSLCEDSLFVDQLKRSGFRFVGEPRFPLEHHFDETRLRRDRLIEALKGQARSYAYVVHHWEHRLPRGDWRVKTALAEVLLRRALKRDARRDEPEGLSAEVSHLVYRREFHPALRKLRDQPRNYEPFGNRKLHGDLP